MKTPADTALTIFFNFRPTMLNYGVQELRVRLATADLLPLPMAQIAEHAM